MTEAACFMLTEPIIKVWLFEELITILNLLLVVDIMKIVTIQIAYSGCPQNFTYEIPSFFSNFSTNL